MQFLVVLILGAALAAPASAAYFRQPDSEIDPKIFRIDEPVYMGVKFFQDLQLIGVDGREFTAGEQFGQPLVLVFSYYTCDGSCSAVNQELRDLLVGVKRSMAGRDYRVLTLSFDKNDTLESMRAFADQLELPGALKLGWTLALIKDPERIKAATKRVGFKFFWQPQDRVFYHPNVFIFLSPEGRVARYLFALRNTVEDVELALLDAKQSQFKPSEVVNFLVSLCYSYNFKEGRYVANLPLYIGVGSFLFGISLLVGSLWFFRKKKFRKEGE